MAPLRCRLSSRIGPWALLALAWLSVLPLGVGGSPPDAGATDPGARVALDTHKLYIHCQGVGSPPVIIDVGLGDTSLEWAPVQALLVPRTRVCLYDRAGYGRSEPGPLPRRTSRIVEELHALLAHAGIAGPYLLVGHSFGGFTAQLFARRHPGETAGVVLVDSSHPDQVQRLAVPVTPLTPPPGDQHRITLFFAPNLPRHLPAAARLELAMAAKRAPTRATILDEYAEFPRSAGEVRSAGRFPPVPLLVLTRGERTAPPGERGDRNERLWLEMQTELSQLSPASAHVIARRSAHHIHLDQPELVAAGIELVVDAWRLGSDRGTATTARRAGGARGPWAEAEVRFNTLSAVAPESAPQTAARVSGRGLAP